MVDRLDRRGVGLSLNIYSDKSSNWKQVSLKKIEMAESVAWNCLTSSENLAMTKWGYSLFGLSVTKTL